MSGGRTPALVGPARQGYVSWVMQVFRLLQSYVYSFYSAKVGLFKRFVVAHQVAGDGKEVDVCSNLAGDEKSMGGMGPFIEDVVLLGDGRIERSVQASVSCIGIDEAKFGSVKLQRRGRGVLSISS